MLPNGYLNALRFNIAVTFIHAVFFLDYFIFQVKYSELFSLFDLTQAMCSVFSYEGLQQQD